jgi:hypothetical protein
MVDKHLSDGQLDDAIDRAVRDLMSVEPRTDLRARVLAELEGAPARPALWPRLAFGGAALALAAVLVAMLVSRPAQPPDGARVASTRPQPPSPTETRPETAPPLPRGGPPNPLTSDRTVRRGPAPRVPAPDRQPVAGDRPIQAASIDSLDLPGATAGGVTLPVERLAALDPIRISSLEPLDMSTTDIVMQPITVGAIEVAPLTPRR